MMVSSTVADDENSKVAESRIFPAETIFEIFNKFWSASTSFTRPRIVLQRLLSTIRSIAKPSEESKPAMPQKVDSYNAAEEDRDDALIGIAIRYTMMAGLCIIITALFIFGYFAWSASKRSAPISLPVVLPSSRSEPVLSPPAIPWVDITEQAGIEFVHVNGAAGEKLLPETMGGGCAFLDYNRDGHPDLIFVNSKPWEHDFGISSVQGRAGEGPAAVSLFENDGQGSFHDVTSIVGLDAVTYGQGIAIGDFDNDGNSDIFVSGVSESGHQPLRVSDVTNSDNLGPHRLFQNVGGRFIDITQSSGVGGAPGDWGTSCGWFDCENDGDLDLWVCHYLDWSRDYDIAQNFRLSGGGRAYGRPQAFGGAYPRLYRNDGGGKFVEISEQAGIRINSSTTGNPLAKSLGLAFHDFDHDGLLDVMVANDTVQNQLFRNLGDGRFSEIAAISGVAFDSEGNARGAMGIDISAAREDPACACIVIGNFANEMTAFYVSQPKSFICADQAVANGLGPSTRLFLTFGVLFMDADLDGWDDILLANGHLEEDIAKVQASQSYAQSPQLFWNAGPSSMTEYISLPQASTGEAFARPIVGRGAAAADIDGDGDSDVVIATTGGKPRLLRNDQAKGNSWLRLKLTGNGSTSNRDAIGARVDITLLSGRKISKVVTPTRSYLSQLELPLTFGLGNDSPVSIVVIWPDGSNQSVPISDVNRLIEVTQVD